MPKEANENREELEIKSEDEVEEEDFEIDEPAEGEDGEGEDKEYEHDNDDTEGEDDKEEEEEIDAKFKGKKTEDVIKMYKNLESTIQQRAIKEAQKILAKGGMTKKEIKKQADEIEQELEKLDFKGMDPKQFALTIMKIMEARSLRISEQTFRQNSERKDNVKSEIAEAQKIYPQLKDNDSFRELVLAVIESGTKQGKNITLKDACAKVAAISGKAPVEKEKKPKVNPELESPDGGQGTKPKDTEEERVISGIMGGVSANRTMQGLF